MDFADVEMCIRDRGKLDVQLIDDNGDEIDKDATLNWIKKEGTDAVLWEPGCTYELPAVRVKNNGNLALKYKMCIRDSCGVSKVNKYHVLLKDKFFYFTLDFL